MFHFCSCHISERYDKLSVADLKDHLKNVRKTLREKRAEGSAVIRKKKFPTGTRAEEYEMSLEEFEHLDEHVHVPKWWEYAKYILPHLDVRPSKDNMEVSSNI